MRYVYFYEFAKAFRDCIPSLSSIEEYIKGLIVNASKCDLGFKKSYKYLLYEDGAFRSFASNYLTEIDKEQLKYHFKDLMTGNQELDGKIAIEKVQGSFFIQIPQDEANAVDLIAAELVNQFSMVVENEIAIYEGKPIKHASDPSTTFLADEQNSGIIELPETVIEEHNVAATSDQGSADYSNQKNNYNTNLRETEMGSHNDNNDSKIPLADTSDSQDADIYPDDQKEREAIHDCILDIVLAIDELLDLGQDISRWVNRQHGSAPYEKCPEWQQYQDSFKEYQKHNNHLQSYLKINGCKELQEKIISAIKLNRDSFWRCYPIRVLHPIITLDDINRYEMLLIEIANKLQE